MPLIASTAAEESSCRDGRGQHVHAVCAVEDSGDGSALVFVLDDGGAQTTAAACAFESAVFSFRATTATSGPESGRLSSRSPTGTHGGTLREALFARSRRQPNAPPAAASSGPSVATGLGSALCPACGARHSTAATSEGVPLPSWTSPTYADFVGGLGSGEAEASSLMAALRVTAAWHRVCEQVPAAQREDASAAATAGVRPSPTTALPSTLTGLHLVRQWSSCVAHAAGNAAPSFVDVFCTFGCGCAALATFTIDRHPPQELCVRIGAVEWILPDTADGATSSSAALAHCTPPLITTTLRYPTSAAPAHDSPVNGSSPESSATDLELLIAWCSSCPASLISASAAISASGSQLSATSMRFARLFHMSSTATYAAAPPGPAQSVAPWQLHTQGRFDMTELLRLRLPSPQATHPSGSSSPPPSFLPLAGVRGLHWLPHTIDVTQSYPLLAVLYAAPTVTAARPTQLHSPPEPCLDSVSVCYLKEDRPQHAATTTASLASVTGRVLVGPWSVRGLALAHPSYCLATALPTPAAAHNRMAHKELASARPPLTAAAPVPGQRVTAAAAFRAALASTSSVGRTEMCGAATALIGVFQRPGAEPYAPGRLCSSSAATPAAAATAASRRAELITYAPGNASAFAFVLYTGVGEAARCVLDGYVEAAHTAWGPQQEHSASFPAAVRPNVEKDVWHVAYVCALLSPVSPITPSGSTPQPRSPQLCTVAVVLGIQAKWTAAPEFPLPPMGLPSSKRTGAAATAAPTPARWTFSAQVTHRLRATELPRAPSPPPALPPFAVTSRVLCWRAVRPGSAQPASAVRALVCGYATLPASEVSQAERSSAATSASGRELRSGVFELLLTASAAESVRAPERTASGPAVALLGEGHEQLAWLRAWDAGRCTRRVAPSAFAAVLASLGSAAATSATALELLSHTPVPAASVAGPWGGAPVGNGVAPVAVAWVGVTGGRAVGDADELDYRGAPAPSTDTKPPAASCLPSPSGLADAVSGLQVVALLRSGDVVGWCAGAGAVLHLCALRCASSSPPDQSRLQQRFFKTLLSGGAGAAAAHMQLVWSPRTGRASAAPAAAIAAPDVDADLLLVVAVGQLVGVVRLISGEVAQVWDVAVVATAAAGVARSADSGSPTLTAVSAEQLQLLPVETACGWLRGSDGVPTSTDAPAAASPPLAASSYLLWSGLDCAVRGAALPELAAPPRVAASVQMVLQLSVVHWTDVMAAAELGVEGGDAPVHLASPAPPPLVLLDVNVCWRGGGASDAGAPGASACVGWVSFPESGGRVHSESSAADDAATVVGGVPHPAGAPQAPQHLCVCDAALLESLWPLARERALGGEWRSPRLHRLRWAAEPTPAASPPSLFRARLRASCAGLAEQQRQPNGRGGVLPLHLHRPCLTCAETGSAPPWEVDDMRSKLLWKRLLSVATLELCVGTDTAGRAGHAAASQTSSWHVLLCTLQGAREAPADTPAESGDGAASFLLCCTPAAHGAAPPASTTHLPACAWHWLPLRLSGPAFQQRASAAVAVASALPIAASPPLTSAAAAPAAAPSLAYFVCTALHHDDASSTDAPSLFSLTMHADGLRHALQLSMAATPPPPATAGTVQDVVYTYDSVDPRLVTVRAVAQRGGA